MYGRNSVADYGHTINKSYANWLSNTVFKDPDLSGAITAIGQHVMYDGLWFMHTSRDVRGKVLQALEDEYKQMVSDAIKSMYLFGFVVLVLFRHPVLRHVYRVIDASTLVVRVSFYKRTGENIYAVFDPDGTAIRHCKVIELRSSAPGLRGQINSSVAQLADSYKRYKFHCQLVDQTTLMRSYPHVVTQAQPPPWLVDKSKRKKGEGDDGRGGVGGGGGGGGGAGGNTLSTFSQSVMVDMAAGATAYAETRDKRNLTAYIEAFPFTTFKEDAGRFTTVLRLNSGNTLANVTEPAIPKDEQYQQTKWQTAISAVLGIPMEFFAGLKTARYKQDTDFLIERFAKTIMTWAKFFERIINDLMEELYGSEDAHALLFVMSTETAAKTSEKQQQQKDAAAAAASVAARAAAKEDKDMKAELTSNVIEELASDEPLGGGSGAGVAAAAAGGVAAAAPEVDATHSAEPVGFVKHNAQEKQQQQPQAAAAAAAHAAGADGAGARLAGGGAGAASAAGTGKQRSMAPKRLQNMHLGNVDALIAEHFTEIPTSVFCIFGVSLDHVQKREMKRAPDQMKLLMDHQALTAGTPAYEAGTDMLQGVFGMRDRHVRMQQQQQQQHQQTMVVSAAKQRRPPQSSSKATKRVRRAPQPEVGMDEEDEAEEEEKKD